MQKHSEYILKIITCILCFAVSFQIMNRTIFLHSHVQDDGTVITHAHPFDKSEKDDPFKSHPHSNFDYFLLDQMGFLFLMAIMVLMLTLPSQETTYFQWVQNRKRSICISIPAGRGPPLNK